METHQANLDNKDSPFISNEDPSHSNKAEMDAEAGQSTIQVANPLKKASKSARRPVSMTPTSLQNKRMARTVTAAYLSSTPFLTALKQATASTNGKPGDGEPFPDAIGSARQATSSTDVKALPQFVTALDAILANIDAVPTTRERSQSEPFVNSWSYHSASPIIPITHPALKRNIASRKAPIRRLSQLFVPIAKSTSSSVADYDLAMSDPKTPLSPALLTPSEQALDSTPTTSGTSRSRKNSRTNKDVGAVRPEESASPTPSFVEPAEQTTPRGTEQVLSDSSEVTPVRTKRHKKRGEENNMGAGGHDSSPLLSLPTSPLTASLPGLSLSTPTTPDPDSSPRSQPGDDTPSFTTSHEKHKRSKSVKRKSPERRDKDLVTSGTSVRRKSSDRTGFGNSSIIAHSPTYDNPLQSSLPGSEASSPSLSQNPLNTSSRSASKDRLSRGKSKKSTINAPAADRRSNQDGRESTGLDSPVGSPTQYVDILISSGLSISTVRSPSSSPDDSEDDSRMPLTPTPRSAQGSPRPIRRSRASPTHTAEITESTDSTNSSSQSRPNSRSRAKTGESVYHTDGEGRNASKTRRRSGGTVDDVIVSRKPSKRPPTEVVPITVNLPRPRHTPHAMWLTNIAKEGAADLFIYHLQTHFKDSQLCEAVIMMHTEVVSSRFLLDKLIQLYRDSSKEEMNVSPPTANPLQSSASSHALYSRQLTPNHISEIMSDKKAGSASSSPSRIGEDTPATGAVLRTSIINFLKKWVRLNTQDFIDDSILEDMMRDFVRELRQKPGIECQMGGLVLDLLESSLHKLDDDPNAEPLGNFDVLQVTGKLDPALARQFSPRSPRTLPTPKSAKSASPTIEPIPEHLMKFIDFAVPVIGRELLNAMSDPTEGTSISVLDVSSLELARQMCLLDHTTFSKVRFRDFLRFASHPEDCPSLDALSASFNHTTCWVASHILRTDNPKKRARLVSHFVSVAEELLQLNNFHAFLGIIIGLTQLSIARMSQTWKKVGKKELKTLRTQQLLASPISNFAALRQLHDSTPPPFVPLSTLFLKDMVILTELSHKGFMNPQTHDVNVEKIVTVEKLLGRLHSAQRHHYNFVPIKSIQQLLLSGANISSDELEAWSARIEPGRDL